MGVDSSFLEINGILKGDFKAGNLRADAAHFTRKYRRYLKFLVNFLIIQTNLGEDDTEAAKN